MWTAPEAAVALPAAAEPPFKTTLLVSLRITAAIGSFANARRAPLSKCIYPAPAPTIQYPLQYPGRGQRHVHGYPPAAQEEWEILSNTDFHHLK